MKRINRIFNILVASVLCLLATGCDETLVMEKTVINPPLLHEFTPKQGTAGTEIRLVGENLADVDTVFIGGGLATITQRINSREMVVKVNGASRTGSLTVVSSAGRAETTANFTVDYLVPALEVIPGTAKVKEVILLEGVNMQAVNEVFFGDTKARIAMQDQYFLKVVVPLFSDETPVDIKFTYNDTEGIKAVSTTDKPFQLLIIHPVLDSYPVTALEGEEIELRGANLNVVDSVMFGNSKVNMIEQTAEVIKVRVPFIPAEIGDEMRVPLSLAYLEELSLLVVPEFEITKTQKDPPAFTTFPASAVAGASIVVEGTDLLQVNQVVFGEIPAVISSHTDTEIALTVPDIAAGTVVLKAIYRGNLEVVITDAFTIAEQNILVRKEIELFCPYSVDAGFYSISLNKTYNTCEYTDNAADIQAFVYRSAGGLQLIDPQNSNGASKFLCEGVKLSTSGKAPKMRFKKINPDNEKEKVFYDRVKDGSLTYLSESDVRAAGLLSGLKQVVRYKNGGVPEDDELYNRTNPEGTYIGGVNLLVEYEADGSTIKRLGFVELVDVDLVFDTDPATGDEIEKSSMTFNFYITK